MISGKKYTPSVLYAAAALELLQTALLTHDDIIDNDHTRRGKQTIFSQYIDTAKEKGYTRSDMYGRNMGICAGDAAIFIGYQLLSKSTADGETLQKLLQHG